MNLPTQGFRRAVLSLAALAWTALPAGAQDRSEITIEEAAAAPENLTSTQDGTVFLGSTAKGTIYRALPDKAQAVAWIHGDKAGLKNVLGLLADEKSNTLWVCDNAPFGRGTPPAGLPALRSFDLKTGEAKGTFSAPGGGVCNDVAIASDGTAYTSDTFGGRILRLKPGAKELEVWASGQELRGADGLSFLADGSLYVNLIFSGKLVRIPVKDDGTAGQVAEIKTSAPFSRPDGLRASGPNTLLQAEGGGRVAEITVEGDRAEVRVLKEGLSGSLGVTQVGKMAFVLSERKKAIAVPMTADSQGEAPKKP